MRLVQSLLLSSFLLFSANAWSQEGDAAPEPTRFDVAASYEQIVADYQRIEATQDADAREAAARLVGLAYRHVIERAKSVEQFTAADLYALGACHEGLGELEQAKAQYTASLEKEARTRTNLALARINMQDDLATADEHFESALKLDPEYPGITEFRLFLSAAYQRERDWPNAIRHLEKFLRYVEALVARQPANEQARGTQAGVERRLKSLRRFVELQGKTSPSLGADHWIQGGPLDLSELAGKVVLVDFFATWAQPCRPRLERLQKMHAKYADRGLQVIGLTMTYGHRYNPETDTVTPNAGRSVEDERSDTLAFAKKREIDYALATIPRDTIDAYGVDTLPHTVLLDQEGKVKMILQVGDKEDEAELEANVRALLGVQ